MIRISFLALTLATLAHADTFPLNYELYHCTQKCGVSSFSHDYVEYGGLDRSMCESRLREQCSWRGSNFSLQGEPNFTRLPYRLNAEYGARCQQGVGLVCRVIVNGVGLIKGQKQRRQYTGSGKSFDEALSKAHERCQAEWSKQGASPAYCDTYGYFL
jgi:hypothetical protein